MRRVALLALLSLTASAQSIQFDTARKIWLITSPQSSYAMGIAPDGQLQHLYWGGPLWRMADVPAAITHEDISSFDPHEMLDNEEYPGWGGKRYYETALKIARADGNRDVVLHYASHSINGDRLTIVLKDIKDNIEAELAYRVYPDTGIISRRATIRNKTNQPFTIESAQSATWNMPPGDGYRLTYLSGRWAAETQINQEPIHQGMKVLESRKATPDTTSTPGLRSTRGDRQRRARRRLVRRARLERQLAHHRRADSLPAGARHRRLQHFRFCLPSAPGETLETPAFYAGYSAHGFGGASRLLHRFEREEILPGGSAHRAPRPVLYNSWEATEFNVNEAGQKHARREGR